MPTWAVEPGQAMLIRLLKPLLPYIVHARLEPWMAAAPPQVKGLFEIPTEVKGTEIWASRAAPDRSTPSATNEQVTRLPILTKFVWIEAGAVVTPLVENQRGVWLPWDNSSLSTTALGSCWTSM